MDSSQDRIFADFEADRWFERNKDALSRFDAAADFPIRLMTLYRLRPGRVLEVGASYGVRLAAISERYGAKTVGVEPSAKAISEGRTRFPDVEFVQGVSHDIPLEEPFDLIIVNFLFHWVDRARLLGTVAEIDRLLMDGGFLIIGDFFPSRMTKIHYHHLPERQVYTYKQNYAAVFTASGLYREIALLGSDHASKDLIGDASESERIGTWLLRKSVSEYYAEGTIHS